MSKGGLTAFVVAEVRSFALAALQDEDERVAELLKRKPWLKRSHHNPETSLSGADAIDTIVEAAGVAYTAARSEAVLTKRRCLYETLGLPSKGTSDRELADAYKKLTRAKHPDRFVGATAEEMIEIDREFAAIGEAYRTLNDPMKRMRWYGGETREAMAEAALPFLRNQLTNDADLEKALDRVGLEEDELALRISDMYHHRVSDENMRTIEPSGSGEAAARAFAGLPPLPRQADDDDDACVGDNDCHVWGNVVRRGKRVRICLQTKAEAEAWRSRRFEKVQIEGTRGLGSRGY